MPIEFMALRIEYTQGGERKTGEAMSIKGARRVVTKNEGPEPARIWWGDIELRDDGYRLVPLETPDPASVLAKVHPFPKKPKKKRK